MVIQVLIKNEQDQVYIFQYIHFENFQMDLKAMIFLYV